MHYDFLIYEMKNKESYICMIIILVFILKDIYWFKYQIEIFWFVKI